MNFIKKNASFFYKLLYINYFNIRTHLQKFFTRIGVLLYISLSWQGFTYPGFLNILQLMRFINRKNYLTHKVSWFDTRDVVIHDFLDWRLFLYLIFHVIDIFLNKARHFLLFSAKYRKKMEYINRSIYKNILYLKSNLNISVSKYLIREIFQF